MKCIHPVLRLVKNKETGLREYMTTPCGLCTPCRLNHSHEFGVRIMHEAKMYDECVFITLTYDDEHLPAGEVSRPTLVKKDLQDFMKRLRFYLQPDKIRFFGCGEYGTLNKRPHYHLIVFGLSLKDKRVFKNAIFDHKSKGYYCLCKAWDKGLVHCGFVSVGSANYVAQYQLKKIKGKGAADKYKSLGIVPEFALMSTKPGIGYRFMEQQAEEFKRDGFCIQQGRKVGLPRYYKDKLNIKDTDAYKKRLAENTADRYEEWSKIDTVEKLQEHTRHHLDYVEQQVYHYDYINNLKGKKDEI